MLRLHELLKAEKHPNCARLSSELEVSPKTLQRDIDFMRDQLGLPIEYDRIQHGFFYSRPVANFPTVQVTQGELVALLVAQKAAEQYRGTAFERPLQSAFSKLASSLRDESGISVDALADAISFRPQGLAATALDVFQSLAEAVLHSQEVEFDYHSLKSAEPERRRVRPYHLGCLANQWYLIGFDVARSAVRTFALSRLARVAQRSERFERPADFSVAEMFAASFSAFQSGTVEQVRIRLDAFAARLAAERKWHPSQKLKRCADGSAEISFRVSVAPDLENWVLGWGAHAEVLAPQSLRATIAAAARAMHRRYAKRD
jgi:predicted DNA-binding transcriptional regulator YafY